MGFLKNIFGVDSGKTEKKGDSLFSNSDWGRAKIEFEKALDQLDEKASDYKSSENRLQGKLKKVKEALALHHKKNGEELLAAGLPDDAGELFRLAIELTEDSSLVSELEALIPEATVQEDNGFEEDMPGQAPASGGHPDVEENPDDYFITLCGTLPEEVREAYVSYEGSFREGYIALNKGDFAVAAECLARAVEENPGPKSYIPLELASAYMNLGKNSEAAQLLENFLKNFPEALPGYHLLCEVYWAMDAFDKVEALLNGCSEDLKNSVVYYVLYGANMFRSGKYPEAVSLYEEFLNKYGWNATIAVALAGAHEKLDDPEKAHSLYAKVMDECNSTRRPVDPLVKRKFVDISYDLGERSSGVLEMYLSLSQEDPMNMPFYLQRVSEIYKSQGNDHEAKRFKAIAEQAEKGSVH